MHSDLNLATLGYTPLKGLQKLGVESSKYRLLNSLSLKYGATINQVALSWLLKNREHITILSTSNIVHLEENSKSANLYLDDDDIASINKEFVCQQTLICLEDIEIIDSAEYAVYKNLDQAIKNHMKLYPSPVDLAEIFMKSRESMPIKVKKSNAGYVLSGGMVRYWAWYIAFGANSKINAIVEP